MNCITISMKKSNVSDCHQSSTTETKICALELTLSIDKSLEKDEFRFLPLVTEIPEAD